MLGDELFDLTKVEIINKLEEYKNTDDYPPELINLLLDLFNWLDNIHLDIFTGREVNIQETVKYIKEDLEKYTKK